jgi:iron transport multicopper oxidase
MDPEGLVPNVTAVLEYSEHSLEFLSLLADSFESHSHSSPLPTTIPNPNPKVLNDMDLIPVEVKLPPPLLPFDLDITFSFEFSMKQGDTYQKSYPTITFKTGNTSSSFGTSYTTPDYPTLLDLTQRNVPISVLPTPTNALEIKRNQVVQIVIVNKDGGEHPFHIHGHTFWVMASGIAKQASDVPTQFDLTKNVLRRDVVTVDACPTNDEGECVEAVDGNGEQFGYAIIRFVADNPGVWLFHCHIEWHIAAGLVMTFVEDLEALKARRPSEHSSQTCISYNFFLKRN